MKSITRERVGRGAAKYGVLPPPSELEVMRSRGMTHRQIAEEVTRRTGYEVTREAVSMALKRAGLQGDVRRYSDLIPWKVRDQHSRHYALQMLRAEARRRREGDLPEDLERRLESWKHKLADEGRVVLYDPDSPGGFYYVAREKRDKDIIRRP